MYGTDFDLQLTPILALLLTHDLLLSKGGVAAPANHVLKLAISRHKARLSAEFTKARIKGKYSTVESFREAINYGYSEVSAAPGTPLPHPRWIRINTLKTTLQKQLSTTFAGYVETKNINEIIRAPGHSKVLHIDVHIPDLLALPPRADFTKSPAYAAGEIIFQDKASCFPAYLLNVQPDDAQIIDGCAAPGNKTSHLAAIAHQQSGTQQRVIAFERDRKRTVTLKKMLGLAGANVHVRGGQDFLASDPLAVEFDNATAFLLDPSCSGSGIVGRDDALIIHLPDPQAHTETKSLGSKGKKRKRGEEKKTRVTASVPQTISLAAVEQEPGEQEQEDENESDESYHLSARLTALSTFQLRILTHAMRFRNARKITYSTCSIHFAENEGVVFRALDSKVARARGWRVLKKEEQVKGLRLWERRGVDENGEVEKDGEEGEILQACLRCEAGTEEGTMGFFVCGFVREGEAPEVDIEDLLPEDQSWVKKDDTREIGGQGENDDDEEWDGFNKEDQDTTEEGQAEKAGTAQPVSGARHSDAKKKKRRKK